MLRFRTVKPPTLPLAHEPPPPPTPAVVSVPAKAEHAKPDKKPRTMQRNHRPSGLTYVKNAAGEFICPTCGITKTRQNSMHYHMKTHQETTEYPCTYCTKSFLQKQTLDLHQRSKHPQQLSHDTSKPFSCPFDGCAYTSHTKGNCVIHCLRIHAQPLVRPLLQYHPETRQYSCRQCHESFPSPSAFYYHVKSCITFDPTTELYRRMRPLLS